jgi:hypothetical protein
MRKRFGDDKEGERCMMTSGRAEAKALRVYIWEMTRWDAQQASPAMVVVLRTGAFIA